MADDLRAHWLEGTWQLLKCEAPLEIEPGTRMEFRPDHSLHYTIPTTYGPLVATLRWQVDGAVLSTELADGTNATRVGITLGDGETLVCAFGGPRAWYVRVG